MQNFIPIPKRDVNKNVSGTDIYHLYEVEPQWYRFKYTNRKGEVQSGSGVQAVALIYSFYLNRHASIPDVVANVRKRGDYYDFNIVDIVEFNKYAPFLVYGFEQAFFIDIPSMPNLIPKKNELVRRMQLL